MGEKNLSLLMRTIGDGLVGDAGSRTACPPVAMWVIGNRWEG